MSSTLRLRVIVLSLLLQSLFACTQQPEAPMRIGTNIWPGYEPLYLANELDYFAANHVELIEYNSASEVLRAFRNGVTDAAALTLDEVLLLAQSGLSPQVVLVMDVSHGGDVILGKPDITDFKQLAQKRIGVERSALGAYMLSRALSINAMQPSDIQVVDLEVNEHETAFTRDKVDAVVTFDPVRNRLLAAGANLLFDSSQIPNEVVDVLMVRKTYLATHPQRVKELLSGWFRAVDYLQQHPTDAYARMARRQNIATATFAESLQGLSIPERAQNISLLTGNPPALQVSTEKLITVMLEQGLLSKALEPSSLFNGDLILQVP